MDKLALFTITHARFAGLVIAAILLGGFATYSTQPRQEDPEITLRSAQVMTRFPGLSPERIEKLITRPIEDKIKEIAEIDKIESTSMTGLSIVTPSAHDRYTDMGPIWANLRNKMDDLAPTLPDGHQGIFVNDDYGRVAVVTLALTGAEYTMAELREVARDVRDSLGALPLVARVDLFGVQDERIWLEFDPSFMAQYGLTPTAIGNALRNQNVVLPGGTVNADGQNVVIEPSGDFRSMDEIRNLAITTPNGSLVYLQDLATIRRAYVEPPVAPAFFNNQPAIVLGVSMVSASNVVTLGQQITARLEMLRPLLPMGMDLDLAIFQPDIVQKSVSDATNNLLQTMVVVLVVVMLFLGWRTGLIVGAMVPLTMMVTLIAMSVFGIALHRISIAAIIVALGLLVDNGVVIAEDIRARLDAGDARLEAALATVRMLAIPLLTSSLTTVVAFLPLVLIDDTAGEFLRSLGQVLALALLASWLLAIALTPALCYWFLSDAEPSAGRASAYDSRPYRFYQSLLSMLLRHRALFIVLMIALLFAAGGAFQFVKQRSLGPSERNQFTIYVDLPAEAHIDETITATRSLSAFLTDETKNPEVTDVLSYIGAGGPRFFLALAPNDPQPNKAFVVVNTQTSDQITAVMARVERFIERDLPQATGRTQILFLGSSVPGTVKLRVRGPNADVLRDVGEQIESIFHAVPGARAVRNDWENPVLKLLVEIDQERARRAGVTSTEIAQTLSGHFDGVQITNYREDDKVIPISIRARADDRDSLDRLRTIGIFSAQSAEAVPLLQIADFRGEIEPSQIRRYNQERALTVAGVHPALTGFELLAAMQNALDEIELPRGYVLEKEGEVKDANESNRKLFSYAPHALFLIVVLLVLQFNSFRRPAIILLTIPLVIIGANFGLAAFGAFFDFTAMLGLFSLAGIIINNGIVMIDRIDQARSEGLGVDDAVAVAAVARARPIILTTITTVVGLLPLALFGGEFWRGMAIVIMCGLGVGTVLTLGFVPVLYSLMFRWDRASMLNEESA
ncbi:MAG: efflux RND transporter permease subunit, partial [Gammaproteobacteria bacterium]|nr:efflux RND transporter permease subunit [Gammaproteobacteria bacterium]